MAIIASTLAGIKSDPLALLGGADRVNRCFAASGHRWRDRLLDPANTMALFVLQILHGNTAISHLRLLWKINSSAGSYCQARTRLPIAGIAALIEQLCRDAAGCSQTASAWLGRRVVMVDGTCVDAPDERALQRLWPQPSEQKQGCGFPMLKLLMLMDLTTGMILQMTMMALNINEASQLAGPHGLLRASDVLLGDRGFCSFAHLALLTRMKVDGVFRMSAGQIVDFTPGRPAGGNSKQKKTYPGKRPSSQFVRRLGQQDQIVRWARPLRCPGGISAAVFKTLPQQLLVRELRYDIIVQGMRTRQVTIATTLLDPMRYPKRQIARLYQLRWEVETNFRHLKTTMKMEHLKCKTPEGVMKELMVFVLVYNRVRLAMNQAAARQRIDDVNRISFIDALRWLATTLQGDRARAMPRLIANPPRPGRWHPRVKKRRNKAFGLTTRPRWSYQADEWAIFIN